VYDNLTQQVIPQVDDLNPDTFLALNVTVIDTPNARAQGEDMSHHWSAVGRTCESAVLGQMLPPVAGSRRG
jgi:hypothetical protein